MNIDIEALKKARDFVANNPELTLGQGLFLQGINVARGLNRIRNGQRVACSAVAAYLAFAHPAPPQQLVDGVEVFDEGFLKAYEAAHYAFRQLPGTLPMTRPVMGPEARTDALARIDAAIERHATLAHLQERLDQSQAAREARVVNFR